MCNPSVTTSVDVSSRAEVLFGNLKLVTSWLEMKHLTGMRIAAIASVTCTSHCSETKKGFTLLVQVMAVSERRVIPYVLSKMKSAPAKAHFSVGSKA